MSVPKLFSCRFVSFRVTSMTRRVNIWQRDEGSEIDFFCGRNFYA